MKKRARKNNLCPAGDYHWDHAHIRHRLSPCHLYLGIPGNTGPLETGVYYYDPVDGSLVHLRQGIPPSAAPSGDLLFMITASIYNSAWKYRGRAYRYLLLDGGHLAENLCLLLTDLGVDHDLSCDFDDKKAGALLGIDPVFTSAIQGVENPVQKTGPDLEQIILNRRSRRNFAACPVSPQVYQNLFHWVGGPVSG